ncbi:hypothetical protein GWC95_01495 [Sediminibacterium roseum]|uniref:Uncharacterized protein n=1 Tax=Sediminibacterium roseum TaxID=1978412 RepID=A0ABW9ZTP4_9BACT|nr:hypothetical protein [Sediminibacterium roseum]NCI48578.1 hypothetical protein [Sediminibacterium roseum]
MTAEDYFYNERRHLRHALNAKSIAVYLYELQYANGFAVTAYLKLIFENGTCFFLGTGSMADNLIVMNESEFKKEESYYQLQEGVKLLKVESEYTNQLAGKQLTDLKCFQKPGEPYCCQIDFCFQDHILEVFAAIDGLLVSVRT